MFKASQDIDLNANSLSPCSGFGNISGPGHTDVSRVQLLNFPNESIHTNADTTFIIRRCGVRGAFTVIIEAPCGICSMAPVEVLDPEVLRVHIQPSEEGIHRVHIKCDSDELPRSPYMVVAQKSNLQSNVILPVFNSDATRVLCNGSGLEKIKLHEKNDFFVNASEAGNNILFVGICGPRGQCDEVSIKHLGNNMYNVTYQVEDPGVYIIAVKWGDDHISGSPFQMQSI